MVLMISLTKMEYFNNEVILVQDWDRQCYFGDSVQPDGLPKHYWYAASFEERKQKRIVGHMHMNPLFTWELSNIINQFPSYKMHPKSHLSEKTFALLSQTPSGKAFEK